MAPFDISGMDFALTALFVVLFLGSRGRSDAAACREPSASPVPLWPCWSAAPR
ncbi:MAG: hypothetical protein ACLU38_01725 [Dysosmobacter sp.]